MPTDEGIFPKVGNDPIYYSEINRLMSVPRILGSIFTASFSSGTNYTTLGSVLIPTGSIVNPMRIYIDGAYGKSNSINGSISYQVGISGTNDYTETTDLIAVSKNGTENSRFNFNLYIGSPQFDNGAANYGIVGTLIDANLTTPVTDINIQNYHPSLTVPMVVFLRGNLSAAGNPAVMRGVNFSML